MPGYAAEVTFSIPEPWGRLLLLLVFFVPFAVVGWNLRHSRVSREEAQLGNWSGYADAGPDAPGLHARLMSRQSGRVIGVLVVWAGGFGVLALLDRLTPPAIVLTIPLGALVGAALGQLRELPAARGPRVASMRPRQLTDYVLPVERNVAVGSALLPALGAAVVAVGAIAGTPSSRTSALAIALLLATIIVGLGLGSIGRSLIAAPIDARGPAGVAWSEIIRAQNLRDLLVGTVFVNTGGSLLALLVFRHREAAHVPDWVWAVALLVCGAGLLAFVILALTGIADRTFHWARTHALAGVAP